MTLPARAALVDEGWNFALRGLFAGERRELTELKASEELFVGVYGHPSEDDESEDA